MTGAALRAWRTARGWSQARLSREIGLTGWRETVCRWETDKVPVPEWVGRLTDALARNERVGR